MKLQQIRSYNFQRIAPTMDVKTYYFSNMAQFQLAGWLSSSPCSQRAGNNFGRPCSIEKQCWMKNCTSGAKFPAVSWLRFRPRKEKKNPKIYYQLIIAFLAIFSIHPIWLNFINQNPKSFHRTAALPVNAERSHSKVGPSCAVSKLLTFEGSPLADLMAPSAFRFHANKRFDP